MIRRLPYWHRHALLPLLPACFHTVYLQDDAGGGPDDGAGHDAAVVDNDAAGSPPDAFSYASCPPTYDLALPGPSRYRLINTGARGWEHSDACASDLPGATHLAVVETTAEIASIQALVDNPPAAIAANAVLIGGVQQKTATKPDESWLGFDGRPLVDNAWYDSTSDHEPNDSDNNESDHKEQFISIIAGKNGLNDADGADPANLKGALCECDGHPVAASAAAAVDSYRTP